MTMAITTKTMIGVLVTLTMMTMAKTMMVLMRNNNSNNNF